MAKVEDELRANDKYMLHLLKGKCYDKLRKYRESAGEYDQALQMAIASNLAQEVLGQIEFRLGWSIIRSKENI